MLRLAPLLLRFNRKPGIKETRRVKRRPMFHASGFAQPHARLIAVCELDADGFQGQNDLRDRMTI
jgi:hypothetical protein